MQVSQIESQINRRIGAAIGDATTTKQILVSNGAIAEVSHRYRQCFGDQPAMIVADNNTFAAAGQHVYHRFAEAGHQLADPFIYESPDLYAEYSYVESVREALSSQPVIPVAVGSGTINDLVKLAGGECERPYMVVATAASMDGYTSFGASITRDGYKRTFPCPAPTSVIVDLDVIAQAPQRLNAAGYADLMAKIPAGADWLIADALGIEPLDAYAWSLVQDHMREWLAEPAAVRNGDFSALAHLMEGLLMTGLGMQHIGSTRPASGAEHQFSHLWDMQNHTHRGSAPMHGEKVSIGTITSSSIYERLLQLEPCSISTDLEQVHSRWPAWEEVVAATKRDFPETRLAEQVIEEQRRKYLTPDELVPRLKEAKSVWPKIQSNLRKQLLSTQEVQQRLAEVGAPSLPEHIGISPQRLHESCRVAQRIRSRYTVLDLINELDWWNQCVDSLFDGKNVQP